LKGLKSRSLKPKTSRTHWLYQIEFTLAGLTKGGQSRWKCSDCGSIKVESKLIATPLTRKPSDLTDDEIEELPPWRQWEAVCTDMIDDFRWEDMWRGRG